MPSTREIRRRIRSVENTAKITNAVQLVAASKMRRAQLRAEAARPYAESMRGMLANLAGAGGDQESGPMHPLLERREVKETAIILITPDRGLAGGLISNLQRHAGALVLNPEQSGGVSMVPVGRKGLDYFSRFDVPFRAEFHQLGDYPGLDDTRPISQVAVQDYINGTVDQVSLVYASFVSTVQQRPTTVQLLPVETPAAVSEESSSEVEYIFEPSPAAVLDELLPRYVEMQVYQAVLESAASEQSARMVAMRNATDAAKEMLDDLTLQYNKARQEQITSELLDIVGGVEALV